MLSTLVRIQGTVQSEKYCYQHFNLYQSNKQNRDKFLEQGFLAKPVHGKTCTKLGKTCIKSTGRFILILLNHSCWRTKLLLFPLLACIFELSLLCCHKSFEAWSLWTQNGFSKAFKYLPEVSGITWGAKLVKVSTLRSCRFQGHCPTSTEICRNPFTDLSGTWFKFIFTLTCKRHEIQAVVNKGNNSTPFAQASQLRRSMLAVHGHPLAHEAIPVLRGSLHFLRSSENAWIRS